MIYKKKILFSTVLFFVFVFFFIFHNLQYKNSNKLAIFKKCFIEEKNFIPKDSIIVVGHAYGSPLNANNKDFISKKLVKFLDINKNNINKLILTGDVFWEPTLIKWNKLHNDYSEYFEIHIAPGNHEVDGTERLSIFKKSNFNVNEFYSIKNTEQDYYVIENSFINNWQLSSKLIKQINKNPKQDIYLFRHNIPVKELIQFANSKHLLSKKLFKTKKLYKNVSKLKSLTIISGDSGGFIHLPRITCHEFNNIRFITNGIADIDEDKILILNHRSMYTYTLK